MNMAKCPYDDKPCPKLDELKEELDNVSGSLQTLSKYLYLIIGMIAINWGIQIW